ncbi:hypothetical protein KJA13_01535 [Patescibacteria group bacterium]|nr:hypothetical protein [Patescibacteria group bacterium]
MPKYIKKILLSVFVISVLFLVFLGVSYTKNNLASLSGIITAWVTINPLEVNISSPKKVEVNRVFLVKAEIENKGEEKIEKMKTKIFLPDELELIKKNKEQKTGVLNPGGKKLISWSVKGKEIGEYIISVKASGELRGDLISAEDSAMVKIKKPWKEGWPQRWFQGIIDFFRVKPGY